MEWERIYDLLQLSFPAPDDHIHMGFTQFEDHNQAFRFLTPPPSLHGYSIDTATNAAIATATATIHPTSNGYNYADQLVDGFPWNNDTDQVGFLKPISDNDCKPNKVHVSRRRRIDYSAEKRKNYTSEKSKIKAARRKLREPRFCFQTRSDVDVLDDGYKWRKYGQKIVKNSLHPRSYYRCTHSNCQVKKRIERLSQDSRLVTTTYEGRHNHSPCLDSYSPEL